MATTDDPEALDAQPQPQSQSQPQSQAHTAATARLDDARARVAERIAELQQTLGAVVEASESANLDDEHDPEGATVGFERAQIAALLDRARTQLAEVDEARDRLRAQTYGVCERCGRPIGSARLTARPAGRLCIDCAASASGRAR